MEEVTKYYFHMCASDGLSEGILWCLLEQKLSLWTASTAESLRPERSRAEAQSMCVHVCWGGRWIRTITLASSGDIIFLSSEASHKASSILNLMGMVPLEFCNTDTPSRTTDIMPLFFIFASQTDQPLCWVSVVIPSTYLLQLSDLRLSRRKSRNLFPVAWFPREWTQSKPSPLPFKGCSD